MAIEQQLFRDALGAFATGVTVVTTVGEGGRPLGITISALASVSLDPPLILICLGRATACLESYVDGRHFAVNILAEGQRHLSEQFASRSADKFTSISYTTWDSGCPILDGCLASLECQRETVHDGGDHVILLGRVTRLQCMGGKPLVHFKGGYAALTPLP